MAKKTDKETYQYNRENRRYEEWKTYCYEKENKTWNDNYGKSTFYRYLKEAQERYAP